MLLLGLLCGVLRRKDGATPVFGALCRWAGWVPYTGKGKTPWEEPTRASTHIIVRGCEDFAALRFIDKRAKRLCLRKHVDTLKGSNHFGSALKYAFTPSFQEFLD